MISSSKKPGVAFWATVVVVVVLVAYPLSLGPVTWLDNHEKLPNGAWTAAYWIYRPLDVAACKAPKPIRNVLFWYVSLWGSRPWGLEL